MYSPKASPEYFKDHKTRLLVSRNTPRVTVVLRLAIYSKRD